MIRLTFGTNENAALQILCLGAHSDDIEIGCGGTVLRLSQEYPNCALHWIVFSAIDVRHAEAELAATLFGGNRVNQPELKTFQDGFMPFVGEKVKDVFEDLKGRISPDVIFTHYGKDAHQDHRLISELTWNTFRNHMILEYEIPKYDGDLGQPQLFVPLDLPTYTRKVDCIMEAFQSQHSKRWFQRETFLSLMRLRGMECSAPSGYAEAFYCRKLVM